MAKHQIFLIHGMGDFEPGWAAGIAQQIGALFNDYPVLKKEGWADFFEFKEITYNQVFEKWRQQWKDDAGKAAAALTALQLDGGAAKQLVQLAGSPGGSSFWQTHVLDVVMYRYLRAVAEEVWREVQSQLLNHLKSFDERPDYSIVCHSLGAAVAYETLHAMLTNSPALPSGARPVNFIALSNTARLLWNRGGDVYTPTMGPSFSDHRGMCLQYFNVHHALDPVCNVDPFNPPPDHWFSEPSTRDEVYTDIELPAKDLRQPNIHAMEHYLGHPLVHVPLLRALAKTPSVISDKQAEDALADWRSKTLPKALKGQATAVLEGLATKHSAGFAKELDMLLNLRTWINQLAGRKADGEN